MIPPYIADKYSHAGSKPEPENKTAACYNEQLQLLMLTKCKGEQRALLKPVKDEADVYGRYRLICVRWTQRGNST